MQRTLELDDFLDFVDGVHPKIGFDQVLTPRLNLRDKRGKGWMLAVLKKENILYYNGLDHKHVDVLSAKVVDDQRKEVCWLGRIEQSNTQSLKQFPGCRYAYFTHPPRENADYNFKSWE